MAEPRATGAWDARAAGAADTAPGASAEDYRECLGEDLERTLDLRTWRAGHDLAQDYQRIEAEIGEAVRREDALLRDIRETLFPRLAARADAPPGAGAYAARLDDIERVHRGLLFNGGVEACDGTYQVQDTLPLTIFQIGVSLVSYRGNQGTWGHRLYRRDLRAAPGDPTEDMLRLLASRLERGGLNQPSRRDRLSELLQRGLMAYAERAFLLEGSSAPWRLGHGSPAPYELITGSGSLDFMVAATRVVRALVEQHRAFVFVASEPRDRGLLTIGQALRPLEYAIVDTLQDAIEPVIANAHYWWKLSAEADTLWDGERLSYQDWIIRFRDTVASRVVRGVYRATRLAPAQVFYAHVDHAQEAAHIALADSVLQEHRGFPLLIDLAHAVCSSVFSGETLAGPTSTAYAAAGAPWRFQSERASR